MKPIIKSILFVAIILFSKQQDCEEDGECDEGKMRFWDVYLWCKFSKRNWTRMLYYVW